MAIDSRQKRMSAMQIGKPFRGALVDAAETGFDQGNRQAAAFMYSGILAISATVEVIHMLCASISIVLKLNGALSINPTLNGNTSVDNC